jgi:hypothetical protein
VGDGYGERFANPPGPKPGPISLKPIKNGRAVRIGVEVIIQMGPESLADDKVRDAVAIYIGDCRAAQLGEGDPDCIPGVVVIDNPELTWLTPVGTAISPLRNMQ